ncbi:MAG: ester cyclase [Chloroflexota bacterium]
MSELNQLNKKIVWDLWQRLNHTPSDRLLDTLSKAFHDDVLWHGPHPINNLAGLQNVALGFWKPFRLAFPDLTRTVDIFVGGHSHGKEWVTATGYFTGTFQNDWLTIPATQDKTYIRFGQFYVLEDQKIVESYLILDLLAVMRQAGFQLLPPARGAEGGRIPPPRTRDGVKLLAQDELESNQSLQLVLAMADGMGRFDGESLASMEQQHYWHPQFRWYGPCGIGTSRSLTEYQEFHQGPWLRAFPDRATSQVGDGIRMGFVAEGAYVAGGIWDWPYATHTGNYLGLEPTNVHFTIRDFDWWRREDDLLVENWVPIDMIDIFNQLGVDLFAKMQEIISQK